MDKLKTKNLQRLLNGETLDKMELFEAKREWKNVLGLMFSYEEKLKGLGELPDD